MALSYDPTKLPQPITTSDYYLSAILVELRAIRIALTKQDTPVEKPLTKSK